MVVITGETVISLPSPERTRQVMDDLGIPITQFDFHEFREGLAVERHPDEVTYPDLLEVGKRVLANLLLNPHYYSDKRRESGDSGEILENVPD